jgi:hypothetical protein
MFDGATKEGIMFHLIGALSEFGKFGVLCWHQSRKAKEYYNKIIRVLDLSVSKVNQLSEKNHLPMSQSRRLAAIMFTDIVGYTAMMGEDEKKALNY